MTAALGALDRTHLLSCDGCGVNTVVHYTVVPMLLHVEPPALPEGWGRLTVDQATGGEASTRHELCPGCRQRIVAAVNAEVVAIRGGGIAP